MRIIVTGSAGFIGNQTALMLLKQGHNVVGIDNHNEYYDPRLKEDRLQRLLSFDNYKHHKTDISDSDEINKIFKKFSAEKVIHLAAQAGVRYSIENPLSYVESNLVGFTNILENCREFNVKHLIYASTSSVYGLNSSMPFLASDSTEHPVSFYGATKKANELMAHSYSHLYGLKTSGLRFFTVYGPWGRPDMALFKFTKSILEDKKIDVYNYGKHKRDFTYIDDIVDGILKITFMKHNSQNNFDSQKPDPSISSAPYEIFNIGCSKPVDLMDYIEAIEKNLGKKAIKNMLPMQKGDVAETYADVSPLKINFDYEPKFSVDEGIEKFIKWYLDYYES
tara:strand:- start:468 stop:1475 length:1008 start_codon:yes stop_codon:yes gene_type:complete